MTIIRVMLVVPRPGPRTRHRVSYDNYSMPVDGKRVLLQAAEFHYFRLPSPDLWRDVLEKYKAAGFNAVSIYFDWALPLAQRRASTTSPACAMSSACCATPKKLAFM